jgi:hypothetical protein
MIPGEVKGAWNTDVVGSLQSQLVQRYMADFHTNHGIYIVLWFDVESWTDTTDSRKSRAAAHQGRIHLLSRLQQEAAGQLKYGRTIEVVVLDASLQRPPAQ